MRGSFRFRLLCSFLAVIALSLLYPALYVRYHLRQALLEDTQNEAQTEASHLKDLLALRIWDAASLQDLVVNLGDSMGVRLTLVDMQGTVVADSSVPGDQLASLQGHDDRPEILTARTAGSGVSIRKSETLDQTMVYAAVSLPAGALVHPLDKGGVLRVAVPLSDIQTQYDQLFHHSLIILVIAVVLSLLLAVFLSRKIDTPILEMIDVVQHIADGGKECHRLHEVPGKEFSRLADAVNTMADRIETSMCTIEDQKAKLETILAVMDEGVMVLGTEGIIRLMNPALVRLFPQAAHAEGLHPVEVIHCADLQKAIDKLLAKPCGEQAVTTLQIQPRRDMTLSVHLIRPRNQVHDVQLVAVFHDVTEWLELLKIKKDFVANVSHELRTPLTAIQGYAETLGELPPEEDAMRKRCIETILRHTEQMNRLVNDLLTLARLESASLPLDRKRIRYIEPIQRAATVMEPQAKARNLNIRVNIPDNLYVEADAHFLEQVFRNLIENACRYGKEGTDIEISAVRRERMLVTSVRDHGPGIEPASLSRVFERFYRVEKHRSGTTSTGLGLSICKHIVERHGGRIWAENTPGATIRFTLPMPQETTTPTNNQQTL